MCRTWGSNSGPLACQANTLPIELPRPVKKDLTYRQFTKGNKVTLQLVVPEGFRGKVLRLAHETLMSGHLGIKKTLDRVVSEFFWPGVCGDVARFCKSWDIIMSENYSERSCH